METVMIQMFKAYMKRYAHVLQDIQEPHEQAIRHLAESIEYINADTNIDLICRQNKTRREREPPFEFEMFVPVSVKLTLLTFWGENDEWQSSSAAPKSRNINNFLSFRDVFAKSAPKEEVRVVVRHK